MKCKFNLAFDQLLPEFMESFNVLNSSARVYTLNKTKYVRHIKCKF